MSERTEEFDEIREIADAICDQEADQKQLSRLQVLLEGNDKAQRFYLEYMDMNASLLNSEEDLTMTIRRLQYEEISIGKNPPPPPIAPMGNNPAMMIEGPQKKSIWLIIVIILALIIFFLLFMTNTRSVVFMTFVKANGVTNSKGETVENGEVGNLEIYQIKNSCELNLAYGDKIKITGPGTLSLKTPRHYIIEAEKIEVSPGQGETLKIESFQSEFISEKSQYTIEKHQEELKVTVQKGELRSFAKTGAPKHYLPLDEVTDRTPDKIGNAHGILAGTTEKSKGLIGDGAIQFNNLNGDYVNLGSGGGKAKASGSFAVTDGLTVEVMTHSGWTGKKNDNDHLFRKDSTGYKYRYKIVLSLQNDYEKWGKYTRPKSKPGPAVSFGIFMVNEYEYDELEFVLDGQDDRPTLEEFKSKPQHIVATYDSESGWKRLYLNGKVMAEYQYPPGTRILTGGPEPAAIGNKLNRDATEGPFKGVIDEFAFYDFALLPGEVEQHYKNVSSGKNYYGYSPGKEADLKKRLLIIKAGEAVILDQKTGLIK